MDRDMDSGTVKRFGEENDIYSDRVYIFSEIRKEGWGKGVTVWRRGRCERTISEVGCEFSRLALKHR